MPGGGCRPDKPTGHNRAVAPSRNVVALAVKPRLVVTRPLARDGRYREVHLLETGDNLAEQLMRLSPDRWQNAHVELYAGAPSPETIVDLRSAPLITLGPNDYHEIVVLPAGGVVRAITGALLIVGAAVAFAFGQPQLGVALGIAGLGALAQAFIPTPKTPVEQLAQPTAPADQPTSLNSLTPARNQSRLGSRVPEVFGRVVVYPDLIFPPIESWAWEDTRFRTSFSRQTLVQVYCIGRGEYDVTAPRIETSPLTSFPGATMTVYGPGSVLPDTIVRTTTVAAATNVELVSPTNGGTWSAWFRLPAENLSWVRATIAWPRGLTFLAQRQDGSQYYADAQTTVKMELRRIGGGSAVVETQSRTLIDGRYSFLNPMIRTFDVQGLTPGIWEARLIEEADRSGNNFADTYLYRLDAITPLTTAMRTVGDYTAIVLNAANDRQAANQNVERFNVDVTRKLPLVQAGAAPSGPLTATRRWVDAMAFTLRDPQTADMDDVEIDWLALDDVRQSLEAIDGGEAALFDGVIDREITVDEQIQAVASMARAVAFRQHGKLVVSRDERRSGVAALFNRRNRIVSGGTVNRVLAFRSTTDPDGVEITWRDRDADFAPRTFSYPNDVTLIQPLRIDLLGGTHWSQAYRRARYEWARQKWRRQVAPLAVTTEGRLVTVFDRISVVDPWREGIVGGEVIGWDAGQRLLTLDVDIPSAQYVRLRAPDGRSTELIACAKLSRNIVALGADPGIDIVIPQEIGQIGTLANISSAEAIDTAARWIVIDLAPSADGVTMQIARDIDDIYIEADDSAIPERPILI